MYRSTSTSDDLSSMDLAYSNQGIQGILVMPIEKDTKHPLLKDFDSPFDYHVSLY